MQRRRVYVLEPVAPLSTSTSTTISRHRIGVVPCCSSSSDKPVTQTSFYLVVKPRMIWSKGRCDLAATSLCTISSRSRKFWTTNSSISSGPYWTLFAIGSDSSQMTAMTVVSRCVATTHDVLVEFSSTVTTTLASALHVIMWRHITCSLLLSVISEHKHVSGVRTQTQVYQWQTERCLTFTETI